MRISFAVICAPLINKTATTINSYHNFCCSGTWTDNWKGGNTWPKSYIAVPHRCF